MMSSSPLIPKLEKIFSIGPNPHILSQNSVNKRIGWNLAALLPVWLSGFRVFAWDAVSIPLMVIVFSVGFEWLFSKWIHKKYMFQNGYTVFLAILFALLLPPEIPWWAILVGVFFMTIIAKEMFGGLGGNIFNPALIGLAMIMLLFPSYFLSESGFQRTIQIFSERFLQAPFRELMFNGRAELLGEASAIAVIIGGIIMILSRTIRWETPLIYLLSAGAGFFLAGEEFMFRTLQTGILFSAFFLVTDSVTTPITSSARVPFLILCGLLLVIFIQNGLSEVESVVYSILIGNVLTPLLDAVTYKNDAISGVVG